MIRLSELKKNALFASAYSYIIKNNTGYNNPYHNNIHLYGVFNEVLKMCDYYNIKGNERNSMGIAALFHDFNHNGRIGNDDVNIVKSIEGLYEWVLTVNPEGLLPVYFDLVEDVIKSTEFPMRPNPTTIFDKIMMDADMLSTYRDNWFDTIIVGLSKEFGITIEKQVENQIKFINGLKFFTDYAIKLHEENKEQILEELYFLKESFK